MTTRLPIFFVIGGPGSGKGTNCSRFCVAHNFLHICAGDLLREEASRNATSEIGSIVRKILDEGNIVPSQITIALIKKKISEFSNLETTSPHRNPSDLRGFILDGFPRKVDQACMFETDIGLPTAVIFMKCSDDEMIRRLAARREDPSASNQRNDQSDEVIRKRIQVNHEECIPVLEKYRDQNAVPLIEVDTENISPEKVYQRFETKLQTFLE